MNCNSVILLGRLVRKPQLRYAPGGRPTCTFQIAVNRPIAQSISPAHMENKEEQDLYVDYPWISVSEDQAEVCYQKLKSGSMVLVHQAEVRTYRYAEKTKQAIRFCPHCGTSIEGIEPVELKSKTFVTCKNDECSQEVILERTRLVTTIRAEQVEFISDNEEARIRKRVTEDLQREGRLLPEKDTTLGDKGLVKLDRSNKNQNQHRNQSNQNNNKNHGKNTNQGSGGNRQNRNQNQGKNSRGKQDGRNRQQQPRQQASGK